LRGAGIDSVVPLQLKIGADGTVTAVELLSPSPSPRLNQLLVQTLKTWKFFPEMVEGEPVASSLQIRIRIQSP
jgi:protein TonB